MKHTNSKTPNLGRAASNGMTQHHFLQILWVSLNKRRKQKSGAGFTMTELLVTIGVMGIIAATTVPAYGAMRKSVGLNATVRQLVSTLREAQNKSISSQDNAQFGVKFNGSTYTLYNVTTTTDLRTENTGLAFGGSTAVIYSRLSGSVTTPGTITIGSKTINVSTTGLVTVS